MSRKYLIPLALAALNSAAPASALEADPLARHAATGAAADGISTIAALSHGAIEANPLMPADPASIVAVTAFKAAVPYLLTPIVGKREADNARKNMAIGYTGVAVNNLAIAAGATGLFPLAIGLVAAGWVWHKYASAQW